MSQFRLQFKIFTFSHSAISLGRLLQSFDNANKTEYLKLFIEADLSLI